MHDTTLAGRRPVLRPSLGIAFAFCVALAGCGGGGGSDSSPPAPPSTGPAWWQFGRDAQHAAQGAIATQTLARVAWQTPVDLAPQYTANGSLLIHYGTPLITAGNTVLVPVKTGAGGGFRVEARAGASGALLWSADSDYVLPAHDWTPSYNMSLTGANRVYLPGAGGKVYYRDGADAAAGALQTVVFYGAAAYAAAPAQYDAAIFINTPLTADTQGNVYFGFVATAANPAGLVSGIARIGADGRGAWVTAAAASGNPAIGKVATNSAPALSADLRTLYVTVNANPAVGTRQSGYLLELDSQTLATQSRVRLLDPVTGAPA